MYTKLETIEIHNLRGNNPFSNTSGGVIWDILKQKYSLDIPTMQQKAQALL